MKKLLLFAGLMTALQSLSSLAVDNPDLLPKSTAAEFPYTMVGQLIFTSGNADYQGSGTVVRDRSVLTAGHNLYDVDGGWSTNVEFNRGRYGSSILMQQTATRLFVFAGYKSACVSYGSDSDVAFSRDMGGLRFASSLADGTSVKVKASISLVTHDAYKIAVGYGAEVHTGDDPLFVEPSELFSKVRGAFYEVENATFEAGMSGGPMFAEIADGSLRVVGVVVSGSDNPPTAGIRALDTGGAGFISSYLKY